MIENEPQYVTPSEATDLLQHKSRNERSQATNLNVKGHQNNLTPKEVADRLRIGRTKVYQLISDGKLASFRIGRKVLVPVKAVEAIEVAK